jgi:hypothetical protein
MSRNTNWGDELFVFYVLRDKNVVGSYLKSLHVSKGTENVKDMLTFEAS